MRIKTQIFICLSLCLFFIFSSCRKGPEDPAISLRSRKARITGDWVLNSGHVGVTYNDESTKTTMNDTYEIERSGCKKYETPTSKQLVIYILAYSLELKISKDGTFNIEEQAGIDHLSASGKWDFSNGVGDAKKKEQVFFKIENINSGSTDKHLFNRFTTEFSFFITQLKNKDMKFKISSKTFLDAKGSYESHSGELTFNQQ